MQDSRDVLNRDHLTPIVPLRGVHTSIHDKAVTPDKGHTEGPSVAFAVVAAFRGGAEHSGVA